VLIQRGALSPVPSYAAVPEHAVLDALRRLTVEPALQPRLDAAFRRIEAEQPELASFVAGELSELEQAAAQALGYFLMVLVYVAFDEAFGQRLRSLDAADLDRALMQLVVDGEVRHAACTVGSYSEDAIALGQPALMTLLRSEVERAAEQSADVDPIMQALLVEIIALGAAVAPAC